jgi:hypothetical protein
MIGYLKMFFIFSIITLIYEKFEEKRKRRKKAIKIFEKVFDFNKKRKPFQISPKVLLPMECPDKLIEVVHNYTALPPAKIIKIFSYWQHKQIKKDKTIPIIKIAA